MFANIDILLEHIKALEFRDYFANIEYILLTNTTFLSSLEERQRSCIDTIGDMDMLDKDMVKMINYKVRLFFNPLCGSQF